MLDQQALKGVINICFGREDLGAPVVEGEQALANPSVARPAPWPKASTVLSRSHCTSCGAHQHDVAVSLRRCTPHGRLPPTHRWCPRSAHLVQASRTAWPVWTQQPTPNHKTTQTKKRTMKHRGGMRRGQQPERRERSHCTRRCSGSKQSPCSV